MAAAPGQPTQATQNQIAAAREKMSQNIDQLLQRAPQLNDLRAQTARLDTQASTFSRQTDKTHSALLKGALIATGIGVALLVVTGIAAGVIVLPPALAFFQVCSFHTGLASTLIVAGVVGLLLLIATVSTAVIAVAFMK